MLVLVVLAHQVKEIMAVLVFMQPQHTVVAVVVVRVQQVLLQLALRLAQAVLVRQPILLGVLQLGLDKMFQELIILQVAAAEAQMVQIHLVQVALVVVLEVLLIQVH